MDIFQLLRISLYQQNSLQFEERTLYFKKIRVERNWNKKRSLFFLDRVNLCSPEITPNNCYGVITLPFKRDKCFWSSKLFISLQITSILNILNTEHRVTCMYVTMPNGFPLTFEGNSQTCRGKPWPRKRLTSSTQSHTRTR